MNRILIVEDDMDLNISASAFLKRKGYTVFSADSVAEAWDILDENQVDLIVSDIMMKNVDGFEFLKMLREGDKNMPMLFMSARDDIEAKTKGFKDGVDDYMVKPINLEELDLRISALLRRAEIKNTKRIELYDFIMDEDERSAYVNGNEINLTSREFDLLYKLLSYPKKTFTRSALMAEFWPVESDATLRTVDVFITRIRDKTKGATSFKIETVHGLGYKAVINGR